MVAFSRKFFLVNSNMVNLLSFSVLSSVWVVCFDLWLFDKNSSFGRANCFYWSKSWHFWSRCGFLVTTTLLRLLHFDRKNKTKNSITTVFKRRLALKDISRRRFLLFIDCWWNVLEVWKPYLFNVISDRSGCTQNQIFGYILGGISWKMVFALAYIYSILKTQ